MSTVINGSRPEHPPKVQKQALLLFQPSSLPQEGYIKAYLMDIRYLGMSAADVTFCQEFTFNA